MKTHWNSSAFRRFPFPKTSLCAMFVCENFVIRFIFPSPEAIGWPQETKAPKPEKQNSPLNSFFFCFLLLNSSKYSAIEKGLSETSHVILSKKKILRFSSFPPPLSLVRIPPFPQKLKQIPFLNSQEKN